MFTFFEKTIKSKPSSHSELKLSGKEQTTDNPDFITSSKSSSPRTELKLGVDQVADSSITRLSSRTISRSETLQSCKDLASLSSADVINSDKDKDVEGITNSKSEKHLNSAAKELISQKNTLSRLEFLQATYNISSSENEEEPKKSYRLDLPLIIAERTDESFHGRVGAYFDANLQRMPKSKMAFLNRITFVEYFRYITEELNAHQRKKYETIQSLVELLSPVYAKESRSETNHNKFCRDLLKIIDFCMGTSEKSCARIYHSASAYSKTPKDKITLFWDSAVYGVQLSNTERRTYDELLKQLVSAVYRGFLMTEKSLDLMKQKQNRMDKGLTPCISWDFLHVLCNVHDISEDNLEKFKSLYNEVCVGLANEFIYVPHMWDYIRQTLDLEVKHHSPYHDVLIKLDKMLRETGVFYEFQPEVKNQSSLRGMFK